MKIRRLAALVWLAVAAIGVGAPGCGDTEGGGTGAPETAGDQGGEDAPTDGEGDPGTTPEAGPTDGGGADADAAEPGFTVPCSTPGDCESGWCVPSALGLVCTETCQGQCPAGWDCREVKNAAGDPDFICVDPTATLCHPCTSDTGCNLSPGSGTNLCVGGDPAGAFCGLACGQGFATCPEGYACELVTSVSGTEAEQCVPAEGDQCTCNGLAKKLVVATVCEQTNGIGTCTGERFCGPGGLTACDAPEAAVEECNDLDDDCDGVVDENLSGIPCEVENEFGACAGTGYCVSGEVSCEGPVPKKEVCNQVDDDCDGEVDEDFPDTDGDEVLDCFDNDDDGDGVPDLQDCKPLDAAVYPGAEEICDGLDNDCDSVVDNEGATGCDTWNQDVDGDGYGSQSAPAKCLCGPSPATFYTVQVTTDCDDLDDDVNPGAAEQCNTKDDDCDSETDEYPFGACFVENEFGACPGEQTCTNGIQNCDAPVPLEEVCNGQDDNCDGMTDEGFTDTDGDGIADCIDDDDDGDGTLDIFDCGPLDPALNENADEICNGIDDDCDEATDEEDALGCMDYYQDADLDTFGSEAAPTKCLCAPNPANFYTVTLGGDCSDINGNVSPGQPESCNLIDDNCDGETDEGVASPCGGCGGLCVLEAGPGKQFPFEPGSDNSAALALNGQGELTLHTPTLGAPFVWVANSGEDTVSKLDSQTGCEVARYQVCDDPSRVAVDLSGAAVVGCRGDGRVVRIASRVEACVDSDGSGTIETSVDDGDCTISGAELVAGDECVVWNVQPDGATSGACGAASAGCATGVAIDPNNDVVVGLANSKNVRTLSSADGSVLGTQAIAGRPHNLAIDAGGTIWVSSREPHGLTRINTDGTTQVFASPIGQADGVAVDGYGNVWLAGGESGALAVLDSATGTWTPFADFGQGYSRDLAVSVVRDGGGAVVESRVYLSHHTWTGCGADGSHRYVSVVDASSLTAFPALDVGEATGPVGLSLDAQGNLWTANNCAGSATRLDPAAQSVLGTFALGGSPETYGDMTGRVPRLTYGYENLGYYRQVFSGWVDSSTLWDQLFVVAEAPGAGTSQIAVRWRAAGTVAALSSTVWSALEGPYPPETFPIDLGITANHLEVEVILMTADLGVLPVVERVTLIAYEQ